jgi:ABC-type transporter Mla MlaB component
MGGVVPREPAGMLKITRFSREGLTIKLEGEILEPCVDTVRDACTQRCPRSQRLRVDMAAVTYADAAGVQLLRELMREGIQIAAYSNFIGELLHRDD